MQRPSKRCKHKKVDASIRIHFSLSKKVTEKWPFSRIRDENAV